MEHRYWIGKATSYFESQGYAVTHEHLIKGNGSVDLLAERSGKRVAVEVETGKSDIKANVANVCNDGFDRVILIATSPSAVTACQQAVDSVKRGERPQVELLTWLDVS